MSKLALVTGATGGIGQSIAYTLADHGYALQIHFNQSMEKAVQIQKELMEKYNVEVTLHRSDLSQHDGVEKLVESLPRFPDIIIHNAGMTQYGLFTDIGDEEYNKMIQLLLTSPFKLTQKLLPSMLSRKWGRIIFVTSIWGETGASCESLYSMGKGGIIALTKALSKEVAPSGITVNAVSPGAIDTPMMSSFDEDELHRLYEQIPMGRMGEPAEIAHAIQFLIEEKSSYITGQVLRVNGGWYM